jgi:ketosteroid isomerase-like protein
MAATLTAAERLEIRLALEDLNADFAYYLDHGRIDALVDLFCEDALYTHGERRSQGRNEIETLFRKRASGVERTSRHLYSGLRLSIDGATEARGTSVCLTFAADGPPPHPAEPLLVADFEDRYRRCEDGRWRFIERHIRRIFSDPANPGPVGIQR